MGARLASHLMQSEVGLARGAERLVHLSVAYLADECTHLAPKRRSNIPTETRWAVWERDDFTCKACGSRANLTLDHIVAWSKGGADTEDNLQTLCKGCNSRKGAR